MHSRKTRKKPGEKHYPPQLPYRSCCYWERDVARKPPQVKPASPPLPHTLVQNTQSSSIRTPFLWVAMKHCHSASRHPRDRNGPGTSRRTILTIRILYGTGVTGTPYRRRVASPDPFRMPEFEKNVKRHPSRYNSMQRNDLGVDGFQQKIVDLHRCPLLKEVDAYQQSGRTAAGKHHAFKPHEGALPHSHPVSCLKTALHR